MSSVYSITVPALNSGDKIFHGGVTSIGICLAIIGCLGLLATKGIVTSCCFSHIGIKGGFGCLFTGLGIILIDTIILSTKQDKEYLVSTNGPYIEAQQKEICCAQRFVHGKQDDLNPLWDSWENIKLIPEGGFRKYPPLPGQMKELWGPTPRTMLNDRVRLTWLGHASWLIETTHCTILTDPNWSDYIPFMGPIPLYYRSVKPGLEFDQLPPIKTVLLSHTHRDHFDPPTLQRLEDRHHPHFYCPTNAEKLLDCQAVTSLTWWNTVVLDDGIQITYVPADHASQTTATDCNEYLWGGYMIQIPIETDKLCTIYFMGDSACNINPGIKNYQPHQHAFDVKIFHDIKAKFPVIDLMLLQTDPVEDQEDKHFNVWQGIDLMQRILQPKMIIPMHYGTWPFNQFGRDLMAPVRMLEKTLEEQAPELYNNYRRLKVGEAYILVN